MSIPKNSFFSRFRSKGTSSQQRAPLPPSGAMSISSSTSALNLNEKRENQIAQILQQPVVDLERIRDMAWAGIPNRYRAEVWRLFLDYEPVNKNLKQATLQHKRNDYFDCLERVYSEPQRHLWTNAQKGTVNQILRDLPRTHVPLLRNKKVQDLFERVLFVWSVRHPASGYVQGMNDLLQPFFFAFLVPHCNMEDPMKISRQENIDDLSEETMKEIEADCFWCFSKLLDGLQDLYTKDQPGLYKMLENLQNVIDRVNPKLSQHILEEDIQYQEFAFRWINCLLVREFSVPIIFRIWDNYLSRHNKIATIHVYVCAALMNSMAYKLLPLNHAEFVILMQGIEPDGWKPEEIEEILAQAYVYERMFSNSPSHLRSSSMPNLIK
jgi:hypothetical protein